MKPEQQVINDQMTQIKHVSSHHIMMSYILAMSFLAFVLTCNPTTIYGNSAAPIASVSEEQYDFGEVTEGSEILHDFLIKNNGAGLLTISEVKTG